MFLLRIKAIKASRRYGNMGIKIDDSDIITVDSIVNVQLITHIEHNPDNTKQTNIYLTSGLVITTPVTLDNFMSYLIKFLSGNEIDRNDDDSDDNDNDDSNVDSDDTNSANSDDNGEY